MKASAAKIRAIREDPSIKSADRTVVLIDAAKCVRKKLFIAKLNDFSGAATLFDELLILSHWIDIKATAVHFLCIMSTMMVELAFILLKESIEKEKNHFTYWQQQKEHPHIFIGIILQNLPQHLRYAVVRVNFEFILACLSAADVLFETQKYTQFTCRQLTEEFLVQLCHQKTVKLVSMELKGIILPYVDRVRPYYEFLNAPCVIEQKTDLSEAKSIVSELFQTGDISSDLLMMKCVVLSEIIAKYHCEGNVTITECCRAQLRGILTAAMISGCHTAFSLREKLLPLIYLTENVVSWEVCKLQRGNHRVSA